jgi:DNA-binding GntR family transcriptional regulator
MNNKIAQVEKTAMLVIRKIRDAILDDIFKPGDWLPEVDLAARFKVSRSPIREALQALENEGTVTMEPYKGAFVKPLSTKEALDIAELRLALINLAAKPAHRHLSPADFELAYGLAKQITRSNSAKEHFQLNRQFWNIFFGKTDKPILWDVFNRLEDRLIRYVPLILKLFPDPANRPRQREVLIEFYRKGKVDEALRVFKKIYLEVVHRIIEHLEAEEPANSAQSAQENTFHLPH